MQFPSVKSMEFEKQLKQLFSVGPVQVLLLLLNKNKIN